MSFTDQSDIGIDPSQEELISPASAQRVAVIRTSDRIQFKSCRRRWAWGSHLRGNLGSKDTFGALWFGSGIHYAMEDFHGLNAYGNPIQSFKAYTLATAANQRVQTLPPDKDDLFPLGIAMMDYYQNFWLKSRDPLTTFVHDGHPQVEVNAVVEIDLNLFPRWLRQYYDRVLYAATFDRVIEDEAGLLWIVDYKTTKRIETHHFQTDPQISAYCWLGQHLYGRPVAGLIYMQLRKQIPDLPLILKSGHISVNKAQPTTHALYRATMSRVYGEDPDKWPGQNVEMLNHLVMEETPEADRFVRRDKVHRNDRAFESEGTKIMMEIEDMLDPTLPLYPNPTKFTCGWCPFLNACVSLDDGSDWQHELEMAFQSKPQGYDSWRIHLPAPDHPKLLAPRMEAPNLLSLGA